MEPDTSSDTGLDATDVAPADTTSPDVSPDISFDTEPSDAPPDTDARPDTTAADTSAQDASDAPRDGAARAIDRCVLLDPPTLDAAPGATTAAVGVGVFVAGVTPGAGRGDGVVVELGVGPGGTDPLATTWRWTAGTYARDVDGTGATGARDFDRYEAALTAPEALGEHAYAARARVGDGPWTACDLATEPLHRYDPAFAGRLAVSAPGAPRVAYCNLQHPRAATLVAGSAAREPVYSRVFAAGVTDRGCTDVPPAAALAAQLGHGPAGSYPASATWTWVDAAFEGHRDSREPVGTGDCHNVEYRALLAAPVACFPRHYAFRYRRGDGPWTYCRWAPPAMGAPTTPPWEVYDPALAGALTVTSCL